MRVSRILAVSFAIFTLWVGAARADCTSPPGEEAVIVYNDTNKTMQFCDGDRWISMLGGVGGGGGGAGGDEAWEGMDLGDVASFDGACEYKFRVGTSWIWPHTVTPNYVLFDASTASFKFGAIEKATKGQYWYRDDGNVAVTSGTPATVDEMQRKCVADSEPDALTFTDVTGAQLSTVIESNTITVSGFNEPLAVSVTGQGSPQISINGGAWGTSGTINGGETLAARLTASAAYLATLTATVTVGGASDSWSVQSRPDVTVINITGNQANVNLFTLAGSPATAGSYEFVIAAGAIVYSTSTATSALTSGAFPGGSAVKITNNGSIIGMGGNGGNGGSGAGNPGGPAISLGISVTIDNTNGVIYGGGGGGGGGFGTFDGGGGGGGGRSYHNSAGGGGGAPSGGQWGTAGQPGTSAGGGGGGRRGYYNDMPGGTGGDWGAAGGAGTSGGGGGAGGKAVALNGYTATWQGGNNGTQVKGAVN